MVRYHVKVCASAIGLIVLAAACRESSSGPVEPPAGEGLIPAQSERSGAPDQIEFARSIPGFGGVFVDEDGVPTVYLTDPSHGHAAEAALARFRDRHGLAARGLRVREAAFELRELDHWFVAAAPEVLTIPGAMWIDLDEGANRLTVGVTDPGAESSVRGTFARLRVPDAAFAIVQTEPIQFAATLQDRVRPVEGGFQIHFHVYLCSLGFNATSGGTPSFVTASHCTKRQGGVESTLYYQPRSSIANSFIGTEVADPAYFRGGACPKSYKCRYSDSARAAYAAGVDNDLGEIAKTSGANNSSLDILGSFSITGEGSVIVGQTASKVGRTTGWTSGQVSNTCVHTGVAGSNIALLCQTFVEASKGAPDIVGPGDSGSPVFSGTSGVTLLGNLWGGSSDNKLFVYSPMSGIELELGNLTTH